MPVNLPSIDYTSRDYASIRQSLLDDAATRIPEWVNRDANDFGMMQVEAFAYIGDLLSYYTDRIADEAFLPTARERASILNIADMLGYRPDNGQPSTVTLTIGVLPGTGRVRIPAGTQFSTQPLNDDLTSIVVFETDTDLYVDQNSTAVMYGTVSATQGETTSSEVLGLSDGTPAQVFQLLQSPAIEQTVRVFVDEGSGPLEWMFYEHLIDAPPTALVYTTRTDAFGRTSVYFGDDVNGRVPFNGAAVTASYRVGGGNVGNVGAGTVTNIMNAGPNVSSVNNLAPAVGGTDVESTDQIRVNAPRSLSALKRAVSLEDYGDICFNVVGVAKANAFGLTASNVTVWIAPSGGGLPAQSLKQRVSAYLANKKVPPCGQTVVGDPTYVPVNVTVDIMVKPEYGQSAVLTAVKNALIDMLSFSNVDFGMFLTTSDVYAALMDVEGVQYAGLRVLARSSDDAPQQATNIQFAPNEIPTATGGVFTVVPSNGIIPTPTATPAAVVPTQPGAPVIDSLSCPVGAAYNGAFDLQVHWAASDHATGYQVVIDFFNGTTYRGTYESTVGTAANRTIADGFVTDADNIKVRVVAVNGNNKVDGPTTSSAYTCGTNTMAAPPGIADIATALSFASMSVGSQNNLGRVSVVYALNWTAGTTPPAHYAFEKRYLDIHGTVITSSDVTGDLAATGASGTSGTLTDLTPAGAATLQYRLGVRDATGAVAKWTAWVGASVTPYVAPAPPPPVWTDLPSRPSASFVSFVKNADGTCTMTLHVIADNFQTIRYDWWWGNSHGDVIHSASAAADYQLQGGTGTPGVHFDGNITITTTAPVVAVPPAEVFNIQLTSSNPNGNGPPFLTQHSY